jgi:transcriptional regulator with XRE-family HTH domain
MVRTNKLQQAPPYDVERCMTLLGENLRTARIRRSLTIEDVAERIGTGPRAVMDAEKGKPTTGLVVYVALLWSYDQLHQLEVLADPTRDEEGLILELSRQRTRVRRKKGLDSDF